MKWYILLFVVFWSMGAWATGDEDEPPTKAPGDEVGFWEEPLVGALSAGDLVLLAGVVLLGLYLMSKRKFGYGGRR